MARSLSVIRSRVIHSRVSRRRRFSAVMAIAAMVAALGAVIGASAPPAAAVPTPGVTVGNGDACAWEAGGIVSCWGLNVTRELGVSQTADSHVAVQANVLGATAVSAGAFHTCAIDVSQTVRCWGSDVYGQVGNGTTAVSQVPAIVSGGLKILQVSAGAESTCALTTAFKAFCWGRNDDGELGNGTTANSSTPKAVASLPPVSQISVGGDHACAIIKDGFTVRCWGSNAFGQLGNNSTTSSLTPVPVPGLSLVAEVSAGRNDTCARTYGGQVFCWGFNLDGELGDGTQVDRHVPTPVAGIKGVAQQLSAGGDHTCAVVNNLSTTIDCWGSDQYGQVGNGLYRPAILKATPYLGATSSPSGGPSALPVQVSAGEHHTCAQLSDGVVECWGQNAFGGLGDATTLDSALPVIVHGLSTGTQDLSEGGWTGCGITGTFAVRCWGSADGNDFGAHTTAQAVGGLTANQAQVSAGVIDACSLSLTGALRCWGSNDRGEVGVGDNIPHAKPLAVTTLGTNVLSVSSGSVDTCAIDKGQVAFCWGDNRFGQLGDGSTTDRTKPVAVQSLPGKVAFITNNGSQGFDRTCAVLVSGRAYCWGSNNSGSLGDQTTTERHHPVAVKALPPTVTRIATGNDNTCAALASGQVFCWGGNAEGELGNGTTTPSLSPVHVPVPGTVIDIAGDVTSFCALTATGEVFCWGQNFAGQLGNGTTADSSTPVLVGGLNSQAAAITGDAESFCALLPGISSSQCWGDNTFDSLGDGNSNPDSTVPVSVQGL